MEQSHETPNFFAIIPANIRYAEDLNVLQKLLYAEITSLTKKDGYCWAKNKYFSNLYKVQANYISRLISDLAKKGYFRIEIDKEQGNTRKIFIGEIKKASGNIAKTSLPKEEIREEKKEETQTIVQECDSPIVQEYNSPIVQEYNSPLLQNSDIPIAQNYNSYSTKVQDINNIYNNKYNIKNNTSSLRSEVLQKSSQNSGNFKSTQTKKDFSFTEIQIERDINTNFDEQEEVLKSSAGEKNLKKTNKKTQTKTTKKQKNTSIDQIKTIAENIENGTPPSIPEFAEYSSKEWISFVLYWTEPDRNGNIRAEKEKTFEIKRRWITWCSRAQNFNYRKIKTIG